jgi:hypothetical protein
MPQNPLGVAYGKNPAGALKPLSLDAEGNLLTSVAGTQVFMGASPSGVTTSAGLATTCVGLILSNPAASGVNLVLRRVAGSFVVAPATVTGLGLITGYAAGGITVHTTALTPFSGIIGSGVAPAAKLDSAATLVGTPVWSMVFSETLVATDLPTFNYDLAGTIVLPPGAYAAIGTTIAGPSSGFMGSFQWEEVAV